jgi:hypothetical protein
LARQRAAGFKQLLAADIVKFLDAQ